MKTAAAITAQAGIIIQGNGLNPFVDLGNELQAKIQDAQDQLSRYPDRHPLPFGAPDIDAIYDLAIHLAEAGGEGVPEDFMLTFTRIDAACLNAHTVGEALDALRAMAALVAQSMAGTNILPITA